MPNDKYVLSVSVSGTARDGGKAVKPCSVCGHPTGRLRANLCWRCYTDRCRAGHRRRVERAKEEAWRAQLRARGRALRDMWLEQAARRRRMMESPL